jgi:DHA2 family multidrug resistance protein
MGLVSSPLQTAAISQIPTGKNAQASGLMGVIKQVGGSFGVAILGTVLASETKGHVASLSQTVSATSSTFKAVLSNASHFAMHATGGTPAQATSMGQSLILGRLEKQAFVSAIGDCFSLALVILSMILVPLLCLKRIKKTVGSATPAVEKSPPPEADLRIARITAQ